MRTGLFQPTTVNLPRSAALHAPLLNQAELAVNVCDSASVIYAPIIPSPETC